MSNSGWQTWGYSLIKFPFRNHTFCKITQPKQPKEKICLYTETKFADVLTEGVIIVKTTVQLVYLNKRVLKIIRSILCTPKKIREISMLMFLSSVLSIYISSSSWVQLIFCWLRWRKCSKLFSSSDYRLLFLFADPVTIFWWTAKAFYLAFSSKPFFLNFHFSIYFHYNLYYVLFRYTLPGFHFDLIYPLRNCFILHQITSFSERNIDGALKLHFIDKDFQSRTRNWWRRFIKT